MKKIMLAVLALVFAAVLYADQPAGNVDNGNNGKVKWFNDDKGNHNGQVKNNPTPTPVPTVVTIDGIESETDVIEYN